MWFVLKALLMLMFMNIGLFLAIASVLQILKSRLRAKLKVVNSLRPQSGILTPVDTVLRVIACLAGLAMAAVMLALLNRHLAPLDELTKEPPVCLQSTTTPESK